MKTVAIITRTKNREIFLHRVFKSISSQTYKDVVWILVNDGGRPESVDEIAKKACQQGIEAQVFHLSESIGMEAASNKGISHSESEFIVIHDDDDSWQDTFLSETVSFLKKKPFYGGVITLTNLVYEKIKKNQLVVLKKRLHFKLQPINISDMVEANLFSPIAFLYRRQCLTKVGSYDEAFPVCGDYEFNLRFLMSFDIGLIPKALANHHIRKQNADEEDSHSNSIIAQIPLHEEYQALMRNKLFREDIDNEKKSIGFLMQENRLHRREFDTVRRFEKLINILMFFKKILIRK